MAPKASGKLEITDLVVGKGPEVKDQSQVSVHYRVKLADGTAVDNSYATSQPFDFEVGLGDVIPGWDQGVVGMRVGGKRRLVVPPELGYGKRGAGDLVPPNATLVFEIELLSCKTGA